MARASARVVASTSMRYDAYRTAASMTGGTWALVVVTFLLVLVTGYYAHLTQKLVAEQRKMLRQQQARDFSMFRPRMVAQLRLHPRAIAMLELVLKNLGGSDAHNVRMSVLPVDLEPRFQVLRATTVSGLTLFRDEVPIWPCDWEVRVPFLAYQGNKERIDRAGGITISIKYRTADNVDLEETYQYPAGVCADIVNVGARGPET